MRDYPPDLLTAMMNNYLVNPSGIVGHWHEVDLLQEHHNFLLKRRFQAKTMSFESKFIKDVGGLNLGGFNELRDRFPRVFGLKQRRGFHPDKKRTDDINRLDDHYREHCVLQFAAGRTQAYTVPNGFEAGAEKLQRGQLATFLQKASEESLGTGETGDEDGIEVFEHAELPSNPIIMSGGRCSLTEYVEVTV